MHDQFLELAMAIDKSTNSTILQSLVEIGSGEN